MNKTSRRNFLQTASILGISIVASRQILAYGSNTYTKLSNPRFANKFNDPGQVTKYLSDLFGVPVTSDEDAFGNWTISINGGAAIPLTFSLAEVQITGTGKVINSISANEIYGNAGWAPNGLQNLFASSGGNSGGTAIQNLTYQ